MLGPVAYYTFTLNYYLAGQYTSDVNYFYIGMKDVVGDNKPESHRWTHDNSPVVFTSWKGSEPGSWGERCSSIRMSSLPNWMDISCGADKGGLCEADPVSTSSNSRGPPGRRWKKALPGIGQLE